MTRKEEILPNIVVEESLNTSPIPNNSPLPTLGKRKREVSRSRTGTPSRSQRNLQHENESNDANPPGPVWIFFSTLRELFIKYNYEISLTQLEEEFAKDESKASCNPPSYTLHEFLLLGLNFLLSPPLVNATESDKKRKARSRKSGSPSNSAIASPTNVYNSDTPAGPAPALEYQHGGPFVSHDEQKENWRWVGVVS